MTGKKVQFTEDIQKVKMEEQRYAYINAEMFDTGSKRTRIHRSSTNSESSLVALDSPNPLYQMNCPRPTSKDLYCTIPDPQLQQLKHYTKTRLQLRKRSNKKDQCFSRIVLFLVMVVALTSLVMVLLMMLRKVGPDCLCTTESPHQPTLIERENVLVMRKEFDDLKEDIHLYKGIINNLTREIQTMRHKPSTSNHSQCAGCQGKQGPVGPPGPPGYNGTIIKTQNSHSMALNSSLLCQYEFTSSTTYTSDHSTDTTCSIRADKHKGFQITGVTCSSKFAEEYYLFQTVDPASNITIYHCRCLGSSKHTNPGNRQSVKCYLHYWMCRMAI